MNTPTIEKVQKLLALARDKAATEAEAASALKMANDLMLKHGIEQDQLDDQDELVGLSSMNTSHTQKWHHMLAISVGKMYGCICYFENKKGGPFRFIGRDEANQAAQLTLDFIVDQVNALYRLSLPRSLSKADRAQYRRDFKHACTSRVLARIGEIIEASMTDESAAAIGCTALVVRNHRQQRLDEAKEFALRGPGAKSTQITMSSRPTRAGIEGHRAGDQVQINAEIS